MITPIEDALRWPSLAAPYADALRAAVEDVLTYYTPIGLIAAGSILRGQGGPTSDIDLYVLHEAPFRQRLQRRFADVPFEIFVNPPVQVRRYFTEEHAAARPVTAHILATGFVMLARDPVVATLCTEAATWLATPPALDAAALRWRSYLIADALDNARDCVGADPANAAAILHDAVAQLIDHAFLVRKQHLPRVKARLAALTALDPAAATLAQRFYLTADLPTRLDLAAALARHLTGADAFFVWDSAPVPVDLATGAA